MQCTWTTADDLLCRPLRLAIVLANTHACTRSGLTAGSGPEELTNVLKVRCYVTALRRPSALCPKRAETEKPMPCALLQGVDMLARTNLSVKSVKSHTSSYPQAYRVAQLSWIETQETARNRTRKERLCGRFILLNCTDTAC